MSTVLRNRVCRVCGNDKFTRDLLAPSGDVSCMNCGSVVEENPIVSEVQFGESASGAAMVQGAMVGADQVRANFTMRNAMESREQTLLNAKKKIRKIASVMRIPDYIVDSASGWFKLALVHNFVQGRRSQNVIAACLYVACRHEKTHHLLIDFSSRLQISVYSLGSTYLKLVRTLQIQKLPIADPSLFIQHFADRLQFGDKTAKVCKDATKLAHRMSLDWIYEGRRPAGIAGACVLLAARMNQINRSHAEIVAVARVGEETIQKRLNEFRNTKSADLNISDFRDSEHVDPSLPPSYNKNRVIEKKIRDILQKRESTLKRFKDLVSDKELIAKWQVALKSKESEAGENEPSAGQESGEDRVSDPGETVNLVGDGQESVAAEDQELTQQEPEVSAEVPVQGNDSETTKDQEEKSAITEAQTESSDIAEAQTENSETDLAEKLETTEAQEDEVEDSAQSEDEDEQLFVDTEEELDDEELEYESRPSSRSDLAYHQSSSSNIPTLTRVLRPRNVKSNTEEKATSLGRLDSIKSTRSRRSKSANETSQERISKLEGTKEIREKDETREESLLRAVLDGGSFKEHEIEETLDRFLKLTDESIAKANESISDPGLTVADEEKAEEERIAKNRPRNLVAANESTADLLQKVRDDVELDEDDEDEYTRSIMLLEKEREEKERIWIAINYDFLIAQEKKRLKVEADELTGNTSGQPKKRRRIKEQNVDSVINDPAVADAMKQIGEDGRAMTPAESAKQIFHKKSFSRKINYGSITELFNS